MIMMIRRQNLPANTGILLAFVSASLVWHVRAASLFPTYMYDQGHEGGGNGGAFGKLFINNGHQTPPVHFQEFGGGQNPQFAPPPVPYEWRDAPDVHSDGDDYADDDYRSSWPTMYGNKDVYSYGGVGGSGRHGRQIQVDDLFNEHSQVSSPMSFGYLPGDRGSGMMKYFNDHELMPSVQHYDNNAMEHSENVPITVLFKTISSPYKQHQQQHIFDLDGHYEGSGDYFIHRVTKPVITEIHEIIKSIPNQKNTQHYLPSPPAHHLTSSAPSPSHQPTGKFPHQSNKHYSSNSKIFPSHPSPRYNYSLMKDRNSHNFAIFNKAYELALNMNKANGYILNNGGSGGGNAAGGGTSHPSSSQGHVEVTGGVGGAINGAGVGEIDEPESDASNHEESSMINSANGGGDGGGSRRDNNGNNTSNLQSQQA